MGTFALAARVGWTCHVLIRSTFKTRLPVQFTECALNGELHFLPSSQATAVQFSIDNRLC